MRRHRANAIAVCLLALVCGPITSRAQGEHPSDTLRDGDAAPRPRVIVPHHSDRRQDQRAAEVDDLGSPEMMRSAWGNAQTEPAVYWGVRTGINRAGNNAVPSARSQWEPSVHPLPLLHAGLMLDVVLTRMWSLRFEPAYLGRGANLECRTCGIPGELVRYDILLSYVSLPVSIVAVAGEGHLRVFALATVEVAMLVSSPFHHVGNLLPFGNDPDDADSYHRLDVLLGLGGGVEWRTDAGTRWILDLRSMHGMRDQKVGDTADPFSHANWRTRDVLFSVGVMLPM